MTANTPRMRQINQQIKDDAATKQRMMEVLDRIVPDWYVKYAHPQDLKDSAYRLAKGEDSAGAVMTLRRRTLNQLLELNDILEKVALYMGVPS